MSRVRENWRCVWGSLRWDERLVLLLCTVALGYFFSLNYARARAVSQLPPVFEDAPTHTLAVRETADKTAKERKSPQHTFKVLVHVAGAVRKPGVYALPSSARVADAVRQAGGVSSDGNANGLNLAARVVDGQQIILPSRRQAMATVASVTSVHAPIAQASGGTTRTNTKSAKSSLLTGPININKASDSELQALPGIGPALSSRIIQYRQQHGGFRSLSDLDAVKGIGSKKLEKLQPYVTF